MSCSPELLRVQAKKVLTSLKALLKDAKRRGNVAQNAALDVSIRANKRGRARLKAGVDIHPTRSNASCTLLRAGRGQSC